MENYSLELSEKVSRVFLEKGLRLAVAESCTGGLVSHLLTNVPGASGFFEASLVCYSRKAKMKALGLRKSFLDTHGTINEETARAMAEAVRKKTKTDFSVATTGNLGPDTLEDRKAGLVFIAVAYEENTTSIGFIFEGSRQEIKQLAAAAALELLYEAVSVWS